MGASKDYFIKLREEEYFAIPEGIREVYLRSKIYSETLNDFEELMEDKTYRDLHKTYKETKKEMEERAYQLREKRRQVDGK